MDSLEARRQKAKAAGSTKNGFEWKFCQRSDYKKDQSHMAVHKIDQESVYEYGKLKLDAK